MRAEFGYAEEEKLGKPYDTRLLLRLYPFVKPYRRFIAIAVGLVIFITFFDLSLPYITKIAIDRYIIPRVAFDARQPHSLAGQVSSHHPGRYLKFRLGDDKIEAIVRRYPDQFEIRDQYAWIRLPQLNQLSADDISRLRKRDLTGVAMITFVFFGIILLNFLFNFLQIYLMEYTGQQVMHDLRLRIFRHVQNLAIPFFNRNPVARLVTRATNDVQNMNELFTSVIVFVFKDTFLLIGISIVLISLNWKLALVSFTVLPFVLLASLRFSGLAREAFRVLRIKLAEINARFAETIGGIRVIQLFLNEKANYRKFAHLNHENYLAGMKQIKIFAVFMPIIEILGAFAIALVIYYGGMGVLEQRVSIGALAAFFLYMRMFFRPIRDIAEKYNVMQNAMASAERLFLLLDNTEKDGPEPPMDTLPIKKIVEITFDQICFAYNPGESVLSNISFKVKAGETIAIVGPTGSGKTSLINLMVRFYDPTAGRILINDRDIARIDIADLRSKTALVMQDPFLFSTSIRQNIFQDSLPLSNERITAILKASNLDTFIEKLPGGLDTILSEGGATISSGQRQLISIARAFARQPELIILDEATSYVDSETEQKIQAALSNLMRGRTAIVIAHRLSTARTADRILVLHHGRIIETGSHTELMHAQGFYYRLHRLQTSNRI
ncbi:MAG: ABC transporter ATP-binding protein [Desulfobacterales bacterium]